MYYTDLLDLIMRCIMNIVSIEKEKINDKIVIEIIKYVALAIGNYKSF